MSNSEDKSLRNVIKAYQAMLTEDQVNPEELVEASKWKKPSYSEMKKMSNKELRDIEKGFSVAFDNLNDVVSGHFLKEVRAELLKVQKDKKAMKALPELKTAIKHVDALIAIFGNNGKNLNDVYFKMSDASEEAYRILDDRKFGRE